MTKTYLEYNLCKGESRMDILKRKPQSPEMRQVIENIASVEEEIQEKIFQLGQMYYEKNKDNKETEPDFYAQIDLITKLDENRKSFYMNKLRLEGKMMCANCGAVIPYGSIFCNICGKKASEKQESEGIVEGDKVKMCSSCGAKLDEDSLFCEICGNRISDGGEV